ncbi:maltose ABC transporter substrate-binding protein [Halalkalibacter kiskunsagensis]|uniref:Maltodextrin-binding protein n=1 Tax=Halalkalibacter kiskunsagensis TaxID=1548599 RepID=A0ABV6KFD5_9BACI
MKKVYSLLFVTLLILVLTACGKPGASEQSSAPEPEASEETTEETSNEVAELEPEEGAELIFWSPGDTELEWVEYVAEKFNEKYGVPVTTEDVSHTDAPGKLQTDGPAGLGGDVFTGAHDHVGNMDAAGLIYENYYTDEYTERFMEGAITGVSAISDGEYKTFGYPLAIETVGLFYNQDLLDEMGFEPAETMEELIEQSKEFMEANPGSYGFMIEPGNFYLLHGFVGANGGYVFGDNNTDPSDIGLNNDGGLKAAELMTQIRDEILPLKKEDITGDVISSHFNEGKLLYQISGPWALRGHHEAGVNFGVTTMPTVENGEVPTTFSGIKALFVNAYSDYPRAATLLAHFATSDEMLEKRYEITGQLPPTFALLDSDTLKEDVYNLAFLDQAQHSVSMPNIPEMQNVWGAMEVAYTSIWNDKSDPQVELDKGVQQIKDAIGSQTE